MQIQLKTPTWLLCLKSKNIPLHSTINRLPPDCGLPPFPTFAFAPFVPSLLFQQHLLEQIPLACLQWNGGKKSACCPRTLWLYIHAISVTLMVPSNYMFSRGFMYTFICYYWEGGQSNSYTFWYSMDCDISASWLLEGHGGDIAMISPQELLNVRFNSIQVPSRKLTWQWKSTVQINWKFIHK